MINALIFDIEIYMIKWIRTEVKFNNKTIKLLIFEFGLLNENLKSHT